MTSRSRPQEQGERARTRQSVDDPMTAVLAGARAFVALVVEASAEVDQQLSPPQLRMLVLIQAHPRTNLTALAGWMEVHPSSATRICDRLVQAGLVTRTAHESDRRNVQLDLTDAGRALLDRVSAGRQRALSRVLRRMSAEERQSMSEAMSAFARAAGDVHGDGLWPQP
jgi:DNA-binding MarR family transcriptional regulator